MDEKIGILIVGINGSIATHLTSGLFSILLKQSDTTGLVTELAEFSKLDLVPLDKLAVGGWDLNTNSHETVVESLNLLDRETYELLEVDLKEVTVFDAITRGVTSHILESKRSPVSSNSLTQRQAIQSIQKDISDFKQKNNLDSVVVVNLSSTEPDIGTIDFYSPLEAFEAAVDEDSEHVTPIMRYIYAAISQECPFVNFTPTTALGIPAFVEFSEKMKVPIAGNDGKTGQTLYKTVVAPMLKWRNLKLVGWFSLNILGNNDGRVLEDPEHKKTKIKSKAKALSEILQYNDFDHKVNIEYYPTRGDAKEAWDTIDFKGWMGEPMSMKINWQGKDSVLAAPLVVDLVRLTNYLHRQGEFGIAHCLGSFFKDPLDSNEHDFFEQVQAMRQHLDAKATRQRSK